MVIIKINNLSPGQILLLGYLIVISAGSLLLLLPISTITGETTSFLDALFTSTSATAVTGLIVVNTASHWTRFGQTIIMLLIQIGGLGFMTSTTLIFLLFGRKIILRERLLIMEDLNYTKIAGVVRLAKHIIMMTFTIELIGALLLFISFQKKMSFAEAWFYAIFHSISAFNNAGFDLFGNSLEDFVDSISINLIISLLFIIGGLGFIVITEIYHKKHFKNISLHSKIVINVTLFLILFGTLGVFVLEYKNPATIGNLSLLNKILAAFFQGVTPRTAGFNTVPIGYFKDVSLFLMIILMFIGASPGSTGGGVKTTTIGTLLLVVYNMSANKKDIEIFGRRLTRKDIYKALSVIVISLLLVALITLIISLIEEFSFIQILFEVVSAFGTVGLSTGITSELTDIGQICLIVTMFIGRVGPFTIAVALGRKFGKGIRYPEEDILIG